MGKRFDDYYLKIGEVSKQFAIEPHILRYWEKEFKSLRPRKSNSGQRIYNRKDVETVGKIKELLHERKFSIEGAKKLIDAAGKEEVEDTYFLDRSRQQEELSKALAPAKKELEEVLSLLKRKP